MLRLHAFGVKTSGLPNDPSPGVRIHVARVVEPASEGAGVMAVVLSVSVRFDAETLTRLSPEQVRAEEWARDPEDAAERCTCSDSPRYRAMGNAVTVSVIEWIGARLYPLCRGARP